MSYEEKYNTARWDAEPVRGAERPHRQISSA